jgi:hypothetical protein
MWVVERRVRGHPRHGDRTDRGGADHYRAVR